MHDEYLEPKKPKMISYFKCRNCEFMQAKCFDICPKCGYVHSYGGVLGGKEYE